MMPTSDSLVWIDHTRMATVRAQGSHWCMNFVATDRPLFRGVDYWSDRSGIIGNHASVEMDQFCDLPADRKIVTWQQATQECVDHLHGLLQDRPDTAVTVFWSGGIDSTHIVAALLLYLPQDCWRRIEIALSPLSVYENPYFFRDYILPNFITKDLPCRQQHKTMTIKGNVGDHLMFNDLMVEWAMQEHDNQSLDLNHDNIIKLLDWHLQDRRKAAQVHDMVLTTARVSGVEMETVCDALWWLGFNFSWVGMCFAQINERSHPCDPYAKDIDARSIAWYTSKHYQNWAMCQHGRLRDGRHFFNEYKQEAKRLIYEVDKNSIYRDFKMKVASPLNQHYQGWCQDRYHLLALRQDRRKIYTTDLTLDQDLKSLGW